MTQVTYISSKDAPAAIGPYSQAVKVGNLLFMSGQIPLDPITMELDNATVEAQAVRVFENLSAVVKEAGGQLSSIVKLNIYLSDMAHFQIANEVMQRYFNEPYPARAALAVKEMPKKVDIEIEGVASID
jgi:reactive intermediate/imine deaminase